MKEYIEKAAVEKFIEDGLNNPDKNKAFGHDAIEIMAEIHYMPAADVAEVRHGRLISTGYDELYCEFGNCTVCGADNPIYNKFCGQCGARMDKEDDHD